MHVIRRSTVCSFVIIGALDSRDDMNLGKYESANRVLGRIKTPADALAANVEFLRNISASLRHASLPSSPIRTSHNLFPLVSQR
jgi:hypothetical protein